MTQPILTSEHLSSIIDECIDDLKNGNGLKMMDFAELLHTLAQATKNEIYLALAQPIGMFSEEISAFKSLISIPILEQEAREKNRLLLTAAIEEGIKSLEMLKTELCSAQECDYRKVIAVIARLNKYGYEIHKQRRMLMGTQPSSSGTGEQFEA